MARDKHPPKKKHLVRPRAMPIPPLTDAMRLLLSRQELDKAVMHLEEAETITRSGHAPNAAVHSAYYAMHHAAAAAILAAGGVGKTKDSPKSHEHVILHYGKLVEKESDMLRSTGMMLSRARNDRMISDYTLDRSATLSDAAETTTAAREMIDAVVVRWSQKTP